MLEFGHAPTEEAALRQFEIEPCRQPLPPPICLAHSKAIGMRSEARRNQILDRARELAVTGDYEGWQAIANEMRENEGRCEAGRVLERGHVSVDIDRLCDQANQIRGPHAHKKRVA